MKKTEKTYDCVEMMHDGALRIHEEIKHMTREQELAYWAEKSKEAWEKYPNMRKRSTVNGIPS